MAYNENEKQDNISVLMQKIIERLSSKNLETQKLYPLLGLLILPKSLPMEFSMHVRETNMDGQIKF